MTGTGKHLLVASIAMACTLAGTSILRSSEWTDYLGNPQRTGYSSCTGPDMPELLWKTFMPGDFDTPPFIIGDKVLILWKSSVYYTSVTKVIVLDLLTGEILEEFTPVIPKEYHVFEVFPVGDQIIGTSFRGVYTLDLVSENAVLLNEIPAKFFGTPNTYPVVLKDRIIIPTGPPVCLSRQDFSTVWNLNTPSDSEVVPYNVAGDETIIVFIMAKEGVTQLCAADPSTGILRWMSDPLPLSLWLTLGKDIYCGGEKVWAFNREGEELWEFVPEQRIAANLVLGPDGLYFADYSDKLYKIDLGGNLVWKTWCEVSPWYYETHLFGAGDILYCFSNFGGPDSVSRSCVTAFRMEDGYRLWEIEFGPSGYIKAPPAMADGILVIGKMSGTITAIASDPESFVKQGDAFLEKGESEKALTSYKKAQELYEKKGSLKAQEIQKKIQELEKSPSAQEQSEPPESLISPSRLQFKSLILLSAVAGGVLVGVFVILSLVTKIRNKRGDEN